MSRMFGVEVNSVISNDKLNRGWMMSHSTKGCLGVNQIKWETGTWCVQSEII